MGEPVSGETVNDAVGIAELVIEERTDNAGRQRVLHIANAFAHVIPDIGNLLPPRRLFQVDEDCRDSGPGEAADKIQVGRFLKRALESLGDLLKGVVHGRAGPGGLHDHGFDDESRVLVAAKAVVGHQARNNRCDHDIDDEGAVLERPVRKINHDGVPSSRTFWPGWRACTPAVTTISPVSRPWEMTTPPGS